MRRIVLVCTVMALVFTVAADTASAQLLFKKIKQRRREELRAEIHAQLSDELSTKLDNDLAREMQIATDTIKKAAEEKIAVESKKLHQQFESAVTTLRKESDDRFVAESKKLEELTANGITEVQKKGRQIALQNKNFQKNLTELNGVFQAGLTKKFDSLSKAQKLAFTTYAQQFEEKLDAQLKVGEDQLGRGEVLQDEIAKAINELDRVKIDMVTTVDDRLASIDEEIQDEVKKQIPAEKPEEDPGDNSAPESPAATTPSPIELKTDDSQDEAAGNDNDSDDDE
jgi:hypothetical protein